MGFTTDPEDARSTPYAGDLAKGFNVPIIHVNADDVEACMSAVRLAMAYRERWHRDVVIDVIGYRRFGHNETDEPAYTQPAIAAKIKEHKPVSELYADQLIAEGVTIAEVVAEEGEARKNEMSAALKQLREKMDAGDYEDPTVATGTGELDRTASPPVDTPLSADTLIRLNEELLRVPDGFNVHRKLRRPLGKRTDALAEGGIDYGQPRARLRLAAHRWHPHPPHRPGHRARHLLPPPPRPARREHRPRVHPDAEPENAKAPFELHNSPLSEVACLGFEYGYSAAQPSALVLWEAQFGDFSNAAQVIIDGFIVSGEAKWGQTSRLTMLLPHGYEGSGPEHSSARIERFLALGAEGNIRIANPTTAGQYFHLLRRQALIRKARPLIVFTPKGLLRLDRASSGVADLTDGEWRHILDDPTVEGRREKVERLVLCTGKIYYDMDGSERRAAAENVAIARVEMLYPFAKERLEKVIAGYPNLKEIAWVQEEPRNMGAWKVMSRRFPQVLPEGVDLTYIGRPGRASPGEGYAAAHALEQERIALTALTPGISAATRRAPSAPLQTVREARPRRALRLGEAHLLRRARDLRRPALLLARAGLRHRDDDLRLGPRDRLLRAVRRHLGRLHPPRGALHPPRGDLDAVRPDRLRDRDRAHRTQGLGHRPPRHDRPRPAPPDRTNVTVRYTALDRSLSGRYS